MSKARGGNKRASSIKEDSTFDFKLEMPTTMSSADVARITAEKVAILSVAEHESQLKMYKTSGVERRTSMASNITKKTRRRRKGGMEADLDGFDCPATLQEKGNPAKVQQLKPPGLDTASQMTAYRQTRLHLPRNHYWRLHVMMLPFIEEIVDSMLLLLRRDGLAYSHLLMAAAELPWRHWIPVLVQQAVKQPLMPLRQKHPLSMTRLSMDHFHISNLQVSRVRHPR